MRIIPALRVLALADWPSGLHQRRQRIGLLVDIAHRGLRLGELRTRQATWQRRKRELSEPGDGDPPPALGGTPRPAPLPPGSVESYPNHAVQARWPTGLIQTPGVSQFFGCQPIGPLGWAIDLAVATAASLMAPLMARPPAIAAVAQQQARSLRAVPEAGP